MKSEYAIFNIGIEEACPEMGELNFFLKQNRIVQMEKKLARSSSGSAWTFLIEYLPRSKEGMGVGQRQGVDYRDLLSQSDFSLFLKLKELRTKLAEGAGLPVYAVFTNEQLASVAAEKPQSLAKLKEIKGIGEARSASYGQAILDCLGAQAALGEASAKPH